MNFFRPAAQGWGTASPQVKSDLAQVPVWPMRLLSSNRAHLLHTGTGQAETMLETQLNKLGTRWLLKAKVTVAKTECQVVIFGRDGSKV